MLAAHRAFRRDVTTLVRAASRDTLRDPVRRVTVGTGWEVFRRQLLLHHQAEDTGVALPLIGATLTAAEWLGVMASLQPAPDLSELVPWLVDGLPANDAADVLAMFPPALPRRVEAVAQRGLPVVTR